MPTHALPPCPACLAPSVAAGYAVAGVPVHCVRLHATRAEAEAAPTGDVVLGWCPACGFLFNAAFDAARLHYDALSEETQGFSATFQAFHRTLAAELVARHGLHGRHVLEIGCGKGEFLALLVEAGAASGVGYDPAFVAGRLSTPVLDRLSFVAGLFPDAYDGRPADFVVCKMTLEHVADVLAFVRRVRAGLAAGTPVCFMVPDARRILREGAFWDVYYEHASYFTPGSLGRLFRRAGYAVDRLWTAYDDQYLIVEAHPGAAAPHPAEEPPEALAPAVTAFAGQVTTLRAAWRHALGMWQAAGRRVVLWGGGSKAVAFLALLQPGPAVAAVVDVNPHKHGTYLPGSGYPVAGPDALPTLRPDVVVVMNPVYRDEIAAMLAARGLHAALYALDAPPEQI